ncbi:MAG: efflux RND transporter permease subunit [Verrucomicrobiales bacterium]
MLLLARGFSGELLPEFREGHFVAQLALRPGSSLEETLRAGKTVSEQMLALEHIATVEQQVGRAEMGEDTWGPHRSEFHIELKRGTSRKMKSPPRKRCGPSSTRPPGLRSEVLTFLGDRIGETISGETAQVVVNVFGDDLDKLDAVALRIQDALSNVKGSVDVQVKSPPGPRSSRSICVRKR